VADPYRISPAPEPPRTTASSGYRGLLRPVLWLVLIASAAANGISSTIGLRPLVGIGFGLVTLACTAALVVHHYRYRRG
jgi:Flp pilus assembly protein TadB